MLLPAIDKRVREKGTLEGHAKLGYEIIDGRIVFDVPAVAPETNPASDELSEETKELLKSQIDIIRRSTVIPKDGLSRRY